MDADGLGQVSTTILAPRPGSPLAAPLPQTGDQLAPQLPLRVGVDRGVDRFVRDLPVRIIGPHTAQCASDLFGRPAPIQQGTHHTVQQALRGKLRRRSSFTATQHAQTLRRRRGVAGLWQGIAPPLPTHRARRTGQSTRRLTNPKPLLTIECKQNPPLGLQLPVTTDLVHATPYGISCFALRIWACLKNQVLELYKSLFSSQRRVFRFVNLIIPSANGRQIILILRCEFQLTCKTY